jgi:hypothetical protein
VKESRPPLTAGGDHAMTQQRPKRRFSAASSLYLGMAIAGLIAALILAWCSG